MHVFISRIPMAHFWVTALGCSLSLFLATFALCEANDSSFCLSSRFLFACGSHEPQAKRKREERQKEESFASQRAKVARKRERLQPRAVTQKCAMGIREMKTCMKAAQTPFPPRSFQACCYPRLSRS